MKTKTTSCLFLVGAVMLLSAIYHPQSVSAQCMPIIKIDGNNIIADENNSYGIKLPSWLKAGQTLAKSQNVFSIAVIEFTVTGNSLDYSQNLCITTIQTVPANKVWKIESVNKDATATILTQNAAVTSYGTAGTFTFTPTCNGPFRVQVWSAGGGGGGGATDGCALCWCNNAGGAGGGGGGYTEGVYDLLGGTAYTVTVGLGGTGGPAQTNGVAGGNSIFTGPSTLTATGGGFGGRSTTTGCSLGTGGAAGVGSGGQLSFTGQAGAVGVASSNNGGKGGDAPNNGGLGGASGSGGGGLTPGGGGGGGSVGVGGAGADGKIIISKSGGAATGSTSRDKLQVAGVINASVTNSCGYVVPAGYVFRLDGISSTAGGVVAMYMSTTCATTGDRGLINVNGSPTTNNTAQSWPYPQWYNAGTYFFFNSATAAFVHGVEYTID